MTTDALDFAFGGQPFFVVGTTDGSLDLAFGGQPFCVPIGTSNASAASVPAITASSTGSTQLVGTSAQSLPRTTGTGTGSTLPSGVSSQSLPLTTGTGTAAFQTYSIMSLPRTTGAGAGDISPTGASGCEVSQFVVYGLGGSGFVTLIESHGNLPANTANSAGLRGAVASSALTAPLLTAASTGTSLSGQSAEEVPAPIAASAGYSLLATSSATLPAITAASTGGEGATGASGAALLQVVAFGSTPIASAANVPAVTASSIGQAGNAGASACTLGLTIGSGTAATSSAVGSSASLPMVLAAGVALAGSAGYSNATLARIIVAAQGVAGTVGTSTLALPLVSAHSNGVEPVVGMSVLVSIPAIIAHGAAARAAGATTTAVVMNTENTALTEFTNFGFNSFARFNGVDIAANANGIFALVGDTDDGALIDAMIRVGVTDYGSEFAKRIDKMYVGYRASGDMVLKVMAGGDSFEYPLVATASGQAGNRVQIGKALAARYWQYELRNTEGADFSVDTLHVTPKVLARRTR